MAGQLREIEPRFISNPSPVDQSVTIVFTAETKEAPNSTSWTEHTFALTLDPADNPLRLAMLQLPAGLTGWDLYGINANGIIAAVGLPNVSATMYHAILLVPVEVQFMKPDSWTDELPEKQVILFEDKMRIKVHIPIEFSSLSAMVKIQELGKLTITTSGTKPTGADYTLMDSNCTFTSGTGFSEIRVELTRDELTALGCLPTNDKDGIDEKSWYDAGEAGGRVHNLSDGLAFDKGSSAASRLRCTKQGRLADATPSSPLDKTFLEAAGAEIVIAEVGQCHSDARALANQADTFYISTEGHIVTSLLDTDNGNPDNQSFAPADAQWAHEVETVIVGGCSVFGIKDFRVPGLLLRDTRDYFLMTLASGTPSPGEAWEGVGPKYLLGYCYKAPTDAQGSAKIIASYLAHRSGGMTPVQAWGAANNGTAGNNACAIDTSVTPHQYWYFKRPMFSSQLIWTSVTKAASGW